VSERASKLEVGCMYGRGSWVYCLGRDTEEAE